MLNQKTVIEAVRAVLAFDAEQAEKYNRQSWPATDPQQALEAIEADSVAFGIRYGLDLLLQKLGLPELVSQHVVGLQDGQQAAEKIKAEYPDLYQQYVEAGIIEQLEAVAQ